MLIGIYVQAYTYKLIYAYMLEYHAYFCALNQLIYGV